MQAFESEYFIKIRNKIVLRVSLLCHRVSLMISLLSRNPPLVQISFYSQRKQKKNDKWQLNSINVPSFRNIRWSLQREERQIRTNDTHLFLLVLSQTILPSTLPCSVFIPNRRNGTKILQGAKCFKRQMNYSRDNFARKEHCYAVFLTDDSISWNTRFIDKLRETRRRKEITKRSRAPQDRPVFCVVTKTYRHLECSRSI